MYIFFKMLLNKPWASPPDFFLFSKWIWLFPGGEKEWGYISRCYCEEWYCIASLLSCSSPIPFICVFCFYLFSFYISINTLRCIRFLSLLIFFLVVFSLFSNWRSSCNPFPPLYGSDGRFEPVRTPEGIMIKASRMNRRRNEISWSRSLLFLVFQCFFFFFVGWLLFYALLLILFAFHYCFLLLFFVGHFFSYLL